MPPRKKVACRCVWRKTSICCHACAACGRTWRATRMGGGVGSRFGEGESQLEVDRRMVRKRITSIRRELEQGFAHARNAAKRALRIRRVQNCRSGLHECGQIEPDKPPCRRRRAFIRQAVRHARFNHAQARVARRPRGHAHRYRWLHPKASDDARRGVQEHARRNSRRDLVRM